MARQPLGSTRDEVWDRRHARGALRGIDRGDIRMRDQHVLGDGLGFTEGCTITPTGEVVVVSIDQGRVFRIDGEGAHVLALLGGGPNGATCDADGSIYIAQNGGDWGRNPHPRRRDPGVTGGIVKISPDGSWRWLTRIPAPNDLCFGPDGLLYVTDPTRRRTDEGRLWRCDPSTGETELLAEVDWSPNGIGFGLDDTLYVASTGARQILRYSVGSSGLTDGTTVIQMTDHAPDGFAFDTEGNLAVAGLRKSDAPAEIQVWTPEGSLLDRVRVGDDAHITNVAIDGERRLVASNSRVGITVGSVVCLDDWPAPGLALHPLRESSRIAPRLRPEVAALDLLPGESWTSARHHDFT